MTDASLPVVILGTAPARDGAPAWDEDAPSTRRLADLAGVRPDELCLHYALDNLLTVTSGSCSTPSAYRSALAALAARYDFLSGFRYLLAGSEVVRALGKRALVARDARRLPWHRSGPGVLRWYESAEGVTMAVLPHPSGRNRWYNDPRCRRAAERFLRACAARGDGRIGSPAHGDAHARFRCARENWLEGPAP